MMKRITKKYFCLLTLIVLVSACQKFSTLNKDPNNITPDDAAPDYLMANVLTTSAMYYGNLGSGNISGAMQQTSQDAFGGTYSNYTWDPVDWSPVYGTLRDNKLMMEKAQAFGWNFHQGVGLVMRAFNYGLLADFWGDAPDSMALKGTESGLENQFPVFDPQQTIYNGVLADLTAALPLLTGSASDHKEITSVTGTSDVFYGGDPEKWTRLANTLLLRYYMRISSKQNVQAEVEALATKVFQSNDDNFSMSFPGVDANTSYQKASAYVGNSNFNRNKMCATLVKRLDTLKDPRIVIMAQPVVTPSVLDQSKFASGDDTTLLLIQGNIRYINPAAAAAANFKEFNINTYAVDRPWGAPIATVKSFFDTSPVYVGIPISYSQFDFAYNINGVGTQSTSNSNYVSYLRRDIYDNPSGELLKQTLASYHEVCFDLAEAAQRGWNVGGSAADWYNKGIAASFDLWHVFTDYQNDVNGYAGCVKSYNDYIAQPAVAYDGTLEQIMIQKWIAGWQASNESFMDWRRTGYPTLHVGWASFRAQIPLRFAYENSELQNNPENAATAIANLVPTPYNGTDGNNSSWSKFWLLLSTNKPW